MSDSSLMDVVHRGHQLAHKLACIRLFQRSVRDDVVKKLSTGAVLEHKNVESVALENLWQRTACKHSSRVSVFVAPL
jgi:hypothetical protein